MRVVYPYTARHPSTLLGAPAGAEWHYVGQDDHAYWRLLGDLWAAGEAFLIVEHDVVCRPDVVEQVANCPEPWCAFPYDDMCHWECMEAWRNTLGCTRFSAEIIRAVPDAVTAIEGRYRDWHVLCDGLGRNLRRCFTHHWHMPAVRHHHMSLAGIVV
jgi:hypothetical protein